MTPLVAPAIDPTLHATPLAPQTPAPQSDDAVDSGSLVVPLAQDGFEAPQATPSPTLDEALKIQTSSATDGATGTLVAEVGGEPRTVAVTSVPTSTALGNGPSSTGAVSPERARKIEEWTAANASNSLGDNLMFRPHAAADRVANALQGRDAKLGQLSGAEQKYLLDHTLSTWDEGNNSTQIESLGKSLTGQGQLSQIASTSFAQHAADIVMRQAPNSTMYANGVANDDRSNAQSLARASVSMSTSKAALGDTIRGLGSQGAGAFADMVTFGSESVRAGSSPPSQLSRALDAINAGPNDATASTFTRHVLASANDETFRSMLTTTGYEGLSSSAYGGATDAAKPMGTALARMEHPTDAVAQRRDAERFAEVAGAEHAGMLFAQDLGNAQVNGDARLRAVDAIASNSQISAQQLERDGSGIWGNGSWSNKDLATGMARDRAQLMLNGGAEANTRVPGRDVDATIAAAMPGADANSRAAIKKSLYDVGGSDPNLTALPIQITSNNGGPMETSLFRVQDAKGGGDRYIDNNGAVYSSFADWKQNSRLPAATMTYPKDGHLTADRNGNVELESSNTPATPDSFGKQARVVGKDAAVGLVAAGFVVGTGGTGAPAAAGGLMAGTGLTYLAVNSASSLRDMSARNRSLSPLTNPDARAEWLNLVSAGAGGAGMYARGFSAMVGLESRVAPALNGAAAGLNTVGAVGATGAGANQAVNDYQNWNSYSPTQKLQATLNLGFTAANAGALARSAAQGVGMARSSSTSELARETMRPGNEIATGPTTPQTRITGLGGGTLVPTGQTTRGVAGVPDGQPILARVPAGTLEGKIDLSKASRFVAPNASGTLVSVPKPQNLRTTPLSGTEAGAAIARGNAFDREPLRPGEVGQLRIQPAYKGGGTTILDRYMPPQGNSRGEIISRKETQLGSILPSTGESYVRELATKYPATSRIADVPSTPTALRGKRLSGDLYLEVPPQTMPIPQSVLDAARRLNVTIRDTNGAIYR